MTTVLLKAILMCFLPFYRVDFPINAVPDQFTFTEHARGLEISRRQILKKDREYSELLALLAAERAGWKYDLSAYAPQRMFKSSGININCVGTRLVVNYEDRNHEWIQLSKVVQRPCPMVAISQHKSRQGAVQSNRVKTF